MPRRVLPKSIRATAAASVVACTVGLAAEHAEAEVLPVWIDAPHLEGTFQPSSPVGFAEGLADFDQDGKIDFVITYYFGTGGIGLLVAFPAYNTAADIFYQTASIDRNSANGPVWDVEPSVFDNRDSVFATAQTAPLLPRPLSSIEVNGIVEQFSNRALIGGIFEGGNGNSYVAYLDLQVFDDGDYVTNPNTINNYLDASITIYDAGYALVPEPSSLALLGLGGLLLARRRRG